MWTFCASCCEKQATFIHFIKPKVTNFMFKGFKLRLRCNELIKLDYVSKGLLKIKFIDKKRVF